jgi:hypothetical protein
MRRILFIALVLTIVLVVPSQSVLAYGGGGGGAGGAGAGAEDHEHASGGVSWTPNPNGEGVIGSSVWRGPRPAGPFQADKSIQDALDDLVRGMGSEFTDEQVKANMEWAQRAGVLEGVKVPPELTRFVTPAASQSGSGQTTSPSSGQPSTGSSGQTSPPAQTPQTSKQARRAQKMADAIDIGIDTLDWLKQQKKQGKSPSAQDIENHVKKQVIKQKTKGVIDLDKPEESAVKVLEKAKDAVFDALKSYLKK